MSLSASILSIRYSKTPIYRAPIYRKPRFTAANFSPQIGLNMHIVNKQNPDLPRTPIYRGFLPAPKTRRKSGFYCILFYFSPTFVYILPTILKESVLTVASSLCQRVDYSVEFQLVTGVIYINLKISHILPLFLIYEQMLTIDNMKRRLELFCKGFDQSNCL